MSSFLKRTANYIHSKLKADSPKEKAEEKAEEGKDKKINRKLRIYCIYFPQFHSFEENNTNFYPDYTDIVNLDLLIKERHRKDYLSPNLKELGLDKITDYNLISHPNLIETQLKILDKYRIEGFVIYYYWFSINSITGKNMLMKDVIDRFFNPQINTHGRKFYFNWANEDWTSNVWFGHSNNRIENKYDEEALIPNIDNLLTYFKNDNYLKIDNKPVLFVHQPYYMKEKELNNFKRLLNDKCIKSGFLGINLAFNNVKSKQKQSGDVFFSTTAIKSLPNNNDYGQYVKDLVFKDNIQIINFDFDNSARMYKPSRNNIYKYKNVTEEGQQLILQKALAHYNNFKKKSDMDDLIIFNAWNEWGERMAIEPSEQMGYYFLDMIKKYTDPFT